MLILAGKDLQGRGGGTEEGGNQFLVNFWRGNQPRRTLSYYFSCWKGPFFIKFNI